MAEPVVRVVSKGGPECLKSECEKFLLFQFTDILLKSRHPVEVSRSEIEIRQNAVYNLDFNLLLQSKVCLSEAQLVVQLLRGRKNKDLVSRHLKRNFDGSWQAHVNQEFVLEKGSVLRFFLYGRLDKCEIKCYELTIDLDFVHPAY